VNVDFSYSTTEKGGVRIFVLPFVGPNAAPNFAVSGSPLYPAGQGSGDGFFTVSSGAATVDRIRFQMTTGDQTRVLFETFVPVSYRFSDYPISKMTLTPPSPAQLKFGQKVSVSFTYTSAASAGVRIYFRPMTGTAPTPNYAASPSPLYPAGTGTGTGDFTISSGAVTVDGVRFQVYASDNSTLLDEWIITASYRFS